MADQTFKKETDWGVSKYDFTGESEITVTITLAEYRYLVSAEAKKEHETSKLNKMISDKDAEIRRLNATVETLKTQMFESRRTREIESECAPDYEEDAAE